MSRSTSILLLSISAYVLFLACGSELGVGSLCLNDSDCQSEEKCVDGRCHTSCQSDADCLQDDVCESRLRPEGAVVDICQVKEKKDSSCQSDTDCVTKLKVAEAQCSIDKICFIPQTRYSLLIEDTTQKGADGMDGNAGSDIAAIFLTDEKGEIIAQATTLDAKNAEGQKINSIFQGGPPRLTTSKQCVEGDVDSASDHLGGKKGFLLVRFLDTKYKDYLERPKTWNINVIEWGQNCGVADDQDTYKVSICTTSSYENIDFGRECVQIGAGEGISTFKASQR